MLIDSFYSALGVVLPMAAVIVLGVMARRTRIVEPGDMKSVDRLVYFLFIPAQIFVNIYDADLRSEFNPAFLIYCAAGAMMTFFLALFLLRNMEDHRKAGAIGQAIVRPNCLVFGMAAAEAYYGRGNAASVVLMGAVAVPLTSALAVVILEMKRSRKPKVREILVSVAKNPLIIATLLGLAMNGLGVKIPEMAYGIIEDLAGVTITLSFLSLGVGLSLGETRANRKPLAMGTFYRMVLVPVLTIPLAALLGFRGTELFAIVALFATPAAVTSYPMAAAYDADAPLAGQLVCSTALSAVLALFFWTFVFSGMGML